jgi:hypothetical protein
MSVKETTETVTWTVTLTVGAHPQGVRRTNTGIEHGVDVDVYVADDTGLMCDLFGEVTLVPREDDPGAYRPYGDAPDHWIAHGLLEGIRAVAGQRELQVLGAIAMVACAAAGDPRDRADGGEEADRG